MRKKIKVSDYIVSFLENLPVEHIFMMSGGGIGHLVDSVGRAKKLKYICNHHEQVCSMAAEAYGRLRGLGVCLVTTGPGGTNTLTGVAGAWLDSIPMLVVAGQVNLETTVSGSGVKGLRQLGDAEVNMVDIVKSITKYSVMVTDPHEIKYHLQKAIHLAKSGRPGPVYLEVPFNIQGSYIDPGKMKSFDPPYKEIDTLQLKRLVSKTLERLKTAERPVLLAGNGIRLAGAADDFLKLVNLIKIPVLSSFAGYDLIPSSNPFYVGRPSTYGQRAANFIIQNSDFLLSIGSRMNSRIVTHNYSAFAREAFKVVVDVDGAELQKPTVRPDIAINYDAREFIQEMIRQLKQKSLKMNVAAWMQYCTRLNKKYPMVLPQYWKEKKYVNSYCFIDRLSHFLRPGEVIVLADGTACTCTYQAFKVKSGQRIILNSGCAAMGYGFPASIGACFANNKKRVICIEGDGSLQLNVQELQTVKHHKLPIKLFVFSNDGYVSVKSAQDYYTDGRHTASDAKSGVTCPDLIKVAKAYGLKAIRIRNNSEIDQKIREALSYPGPVVCDIQMDPYQTLFPKLLPDHRPDGSFLAKPLEDMYPFLHREEFLENMIIKPWEG
jgi:acetolactate synthase I/II/III large subunit